MAVDIFVGTLSCFDRLSLWSSMSEIYLYRWDVRSVVCRGTWIITIATMFFLPLGSSMSVLSSFSNFIHKWVDFFSFLVLSYFYIEDHIRYSSHIIFVLFLGFVICLHGRSYLLFFSHNIEDHICYSFHIIFVLLIRAKRARSNIVYVLSILQ